MDNKGYIFTTDAVLALVIFFVIAGSLLTYYTLPSYMGADHQHLEAEADSALALLTSSDDLQIAMLKIKSNDSKKQLEGKELLKGKLNLILPADVAYDLKIDDESSGISNDRGILTSNDRVSRYSVISAPAEGWIGRAWYKLEDVQFVEKKINTTQTLWNFHNYLANFPNWNSNGKFRDYQYWGIKSKSDKNPVPIDFSIPLDAELKRAFVIVGCQGVGGLRSYYRPSKLFTKETGGQQTLQYVGYNDNKWYPVNDTWDDVNGVWAKGSLYSEVAGAKTNKPYESGGYPVTFLYNDIMPSYGVYVGFEDNHGNKNIHTLGWSESKNSPFKFVLKRANTANENQRIPIYNAKSDIPIKYVSTGLNNFYVRFMNVSSSSYNMPWFGLLSEYETSILVPNGIENHRFPDVNETKSYNCAGAAVPVRDNNPQAYYITYDLDTGATNKVMDASREIDFAKYRGHDSNLADGKPFVLRKDSNCPFPGSAVAREYEIDLTPDSEIGKVREGTRVVDAYTVVNSYGATDKVLVEVYDGEKWNEAFYSLTNTDLTGNGKGYGNTPGTVYIGDYLKVGVKNKVRVTVWDDASSYDYDFVGLVDTYNVVTFTSLPIGWDTFHFDNKQSQVNLYGQEQTLSQTKTFDISSDPVSEKVMFFFGVGLDTSHVKLEVSKNQNKWETLYDGDTIPYALDIGAIDAGIATAEGANGGQNLFATSSGDGNYTTESGKYYVRLTVTTGSDWKSGDEKQSGTHGGSACCEIFSGSRVAVLYPKFLENMWVNEYADTAKGAKDKAEATLRQQLRDVYHFSDDKLDKIQSEALYTGDMPNTVPIRLDLWRS